MNRRANVRFRPRYFILQRIHHKSSTGGLLIDTPSWDVKRTSWSRIPPLPESMTVAFRGLHGPLKQNQAGKNHSCAKTQDEILSGRKPLINKMCGNARKAAPRSWWLRIPIVIHQQPLDLRCVGALRISTDQLSARDENPLFHTANRLHTTTATMPLPRWYMPSMCAT